MSHLEQDEQTPITRAEAEADVRRITRRCRGPLSPESATIVAALLRDGREVEARLEDRAGRQGCGADFNDIICARPFDGSEQAYTCPKCGLTGTYTAPRYVLADAPTVED